MKPISRIVPVLSGLAALLLLAVPARAQQRDEFGEIHQTVARISYVTGEVSFARGDQPDDWQPADRNVPMTLGDRVYTGGRSRIELQVHGGSIIRLGARSDLAALNLTEDTKQFSMRVGIASFRVRHLADYETFEVDTPNAAVVFERPGDYRMDVSENGDTHVMVRRGSASIAAAGGQVPVNEGEGIEIYGIDRPQYDFVRLSSPDAWDQWVNEREGRYTQARSIRYISPDIVGGDDLDEYGSWEQVPQYGWCWTPRAVAVDWAPYRAGHWVWQDPWGWSWVSAEPWGWAPYHYGRWAVVSSRWYWIPVASTVRYVSYSPALVAFAGGGPGWSLTVSSAGAGFIGWFPLGPRDPFVPWWGVSVGVRPTTVTNVTYVNRSYITVVNRTTFVSGGIVTGAWVRDRSVVTQVASAPVLRGPLPVVPTAAALRVAVRTEASAAPRPPAAIVERSVVVRAAPPPAPPTFQAKLGVITENRGAPVAPEAAARISVENRGRPRTVTDVRPAVEAPGRGVQLAPRSAEAGERGRRPEPITAPRGRAMATADQPVASSPAAAPSGQPSRQVVPRESLPPGESQVPPGQERVPPGQERGRERSAAPPAPSEAQPVPERGRERVAPPENPPAQSPESSRQRVAPTRPPEATQERRRIEPAPAPPPQGAPAQSPGMQRGRERPTPTSEAPPGQERRRAGAPSGPPQEAPAQPPPNAQRGRERPTPAPEAAREAAPSRGRQAGPPPQQPPPQAAPQGENRPQQVERGRPANPPKQQEEPKKGKGEEKKDKEKEERGRKPTPTP